MEHVSTVLMSAPRKAYSVFWSVLICKNQFQSDEVKEKKKKSKKASEKSADAAPAAEEAPAPAAAPKTSSKKRAQRSGSNVFAM